MFQKQFIVLALLLVMTTCISGNLFHLSTILNGIGGECTPNLNSIIDVLIGKYIRMFDPLHLPDINATDTFMFAPNVTGLSSLYRSCNIVVVLDPISKNLTLSFCLAVNETRLETKLKMKVMFTNVNSYMKIIISDLTVHINVTAQLKTGGSIVINKIGLATIGKVNIDNSGFLGIMDPLVNVMMKTRVKDAVVNIINKKLPNIINETLSKYPL